MSGYDYNSQAMPLITAATRPNTPARIAIVLNNPPRTVEENASTQPMAPNNRAAIARMRPKNAPDAKLPTAQTMAMIDGMLNFA